MKKKRVLFIAEAATLAHVARPLALSASLDKNEFDLSIACASRSDWLLRDFPGERYPLDSVDGAHFLAALAHGKPLYDEALLRRYVEADLALLDKVRPDAVIGDFRLSLSVSARLARVSYLAISNCYWSPYWSPARYPVPNLPLTRIFPLGLAEVLFRIARPVAFALHCGPLNRVRRRYGLPSLGTDLRRVYTDADQVVYCDVPELFPEARLPSHHHFIGPVLWSPPVPLPDWWNQIPGDRPVIYVTLGSSGQAELLLPVLKVLGALDVTVIASTAGGAVLEGLSSNVHVASYLPGDAAARLAKLVICNGGSPTSQQALSAGVPVIGIAGNLDQFLNMGTIQAAGAGTVMRGDRFEPAALKSIATEILENASYTAAAEKVGAWFGRYSAGARFAAIVSRLVAQGG